MQVSGIAVPLDRQPDTRIASGPRQAQVIVNTRAFSNVRQRCLARWVRVNVTQVPGRRDFA